MKNRIIESKINSIVDKILNEELSTKVNSAVNRVNEKWEGDVEVKKTGEHAKKTIAQLEKELEALKKKSKQLQDKGEKVPKSHKEQESEIVFAIRAKKDWPKGKGSMDEGNDMEDMYLGIGDHGFYDKSDRQMKDFDFDYDEEEYDDFDEFVSKYPNQSWFPMDDKDETDFDFKLRPGRKFWDMYKEKFGGPFKLRKRRPMGEEVDEMEENYKVAKERKAARMEKNEELKGNQDKIDKNKNGKIDAEDFKLLRKDKKEKPRTPAGFEHGEIVSGYMKESKKKTIQLTEDEVIELIQRLVMEEKEQNSIKITNKNLKDSKKENDESTKETTKKMKEYTKNMGVSYEADNKEFPRGNTKMDIEDMGKIKKNSDKKKAYKASDAVEEYIDQIARSGGMENLDYDQIKPNDEWLELNIEGSSKTGNSQDYANAIPTDVNKKVNERRKKNILAMLKKQSYQKAPQSVYDVAGESTHLEKMLGIGESVDEKKQTKINEDIDKMKNLLNYRKNTQ